MVQVDTMRIVVLTSDKTMHALPAFAHQLNKHMPWEDGILVAGFSPLPFHLPPNFDYVSIGNFEDYPYQKWSNALIVLLEALRDERILWMMDDFWLMRKADVEAIHMLDRFMSTRLDIARIDLSSDRLYAANAGDVIYVDRLDLLASHLPVPYLLSFQAGIWDRKKLLQYLRPDETAAETELFGSQRMNDEKAIVYGTRQTPLRYLIAVQHGKAALDGGYQRPHVLIPQMEINELRELGFLQGLE